MLSVLLTLAIICLPGVIICDTFEEANYGVKYASQCEVCKILVTELELKLEETGKDGSVIETRYHLDARQDNKKKKNYKDSQLRLIESMEEACDGILQYSIHKERKDSTRFDRGQSQTFSTLHGLVAKGVKVDLGIPYELWDKPSAEITFLKSQCEDMMEKYESKIEEWYNRRQSEVSLAEYLCKNIVLKNKNFECLYETKKPEVEAKTEL
jgi:hypothetical protein